MFMYYMLVVCALFGKTRELRVIECILVVFDKNHSFSKANHDQPHKKNYDESMCVAVNYSIST
jgi:hypothetical protein